MFYATHLETGFVFHDIIYDAAPVETPERIVSVAEKMKKKSKFERPLRVIKVHRNKINFTLLCPASYIPERFHCVAPLDKR